MKTSYTYGDSDAASRRLSKLSEAYGPSSERLLSSLPTDDIQTAVDLGCGPGYTTHIIADIVQPTSLTAVDSSPAFLKEAAGRVPAVRLIQADVSHSPFPWEGADLTYCRFVLGHLSTPLQVLRDWLTHAPLGGVVVAQEYERIVADDEVVTRYLVASEAMVASSNATLRLGPQLERDLASSVEGVGTVVHNEVATFPVRAALMAEIFLLNIPALRERRALSAGELDRLEHDLTRYKGSDEIVSASVREIVVRRD